MDNNGYTEVDYSLPAAIRHKYITLLLTGAAVIILGVFSSAVFRGSLLMMGFPLLIGLLLIGFSFYFRYTIEKNGYDEVVGVCVDHSSLLNILTTRHSADSFILKCESGVFSVPNVRRKSPVPIGCNVRLYVPKGSNPVKDITGYLSYPTIYAYELLGSMEP